MDNKTKGNWIKAFMVPVVAFLLVLPLAVQSPQAAAGPALQEATATIATDASTPTAGTTDTTTQPTAVATTTQSQGNDFPWWILLLPLAALLLIPLFLRRPKTEVVTTRTVDTTPRPTTTSSTSTRTTVTPTRTEDRHNDHEHS
jgi:hypothetical protein